MKRAVKAMLGVTLLEIMLVLAIAAMVIVLSIRYYQSAQYSSQANELMSRFQAITAATENLSQGSGNYSGVTQSLLEPLLPTNAFVSPWGADVSFSATKDSFTVTVPEVPAGVCSVMVLKLSNDPHTSRSTSTCVTKGSFSYTYVLNP